MNDTAMATTGMEITKKPTISERLQKEKKNLVGRLEELNAAIALLEKNPDTLAVMDALSKVIYMGY